MEMVKREEPYFVHTEYHKRGTNSIGTNRADEEEAEEEEEEETDVGEDTKPPAKAKSLTFTPERDFKDIECNINGETTVKCKRDKDDEVYLPWSFVKPYFEVGGKSDKYTYDNFSC